MKTLIIAEAGSNHNKNFNQALSLIDTAINSGSDIVKFQTFKSEEVYVSNTPNFANYKNINKLVKDIEIPREWQKNLKQYCDENGIEFMSTPFDEKAVDELVNLGVKRLKIAGFESTDWRFVDMVASTGLPLIISIGIGFKEEYLDIINAITRDYNNDVTLLHCNNAYPTPTSDINLNTIPYLIKNTNCKIGLSDHTTSTLTPAIAVAAGATTIERHFTLDKNLPGPDHAFALEPNQLKEMIDKIAFAEIMMGGIKGEYSKSELNFTKARRSIVAKSNIKVGDLLTVDNITTKRPYLEGNVAASEWFNILGKKSSKNYKPDDFIKW